MKAAERGDTRQGKLGHLKQTLPEQTNVARAEYDRWATFGDADPEIPSAIVSYTTTHKCLVNDPDYSGVH
jgi:hypothetical protein